MDKASEKRLGEKILIVEDDDQNRELLRDLLNMKGYHTLEAENGENALKAVLKELPDLILLDIQLPEIDGVEVARRLKSNPETRSIPIIAITAHAMKGYGESLIKQGFSAYVSKPFVMNEFLEVIKGFLSK